MHILFSLLTLILELSNTSPHCAYQTKKFPPSPPSQKLFYCQLPTPFKFAMHFMRQTKLYLELTRISKNFDDKTLLYHPQLQFLPNRKPHPDFITNKPCYLPRILPKITKNDERMCQQLSVLRLSHPIKNKKTVV